MIPRTDRLTAATLAMFDGGLPWRRILLLTQGRGSQWWRKVVALAEDDGLLAWDRCASRWTLTEAGRQHVYDNARGAA